MTLMPFMPGPGICKVDSPYAAGHEMGYIPGLPVRGRYSDCNGVRFYAGFPEKIKGYQSLGATGIIGTPRGARDWRDNSGNIDLGFGTEKKLYYFQNNTVTDITPLRVITSGTLTNALITGGANSTTVTVIHGTHGLLTGDYVTLVSTSTVNGISPVGVFAPITVLDGTSYNIQNPVAATGSSSGVGANVTYQYFRVVLGSNPFATVSGSAIVTITHTAHGAATGDYVNIAGATVINNITLSGDYLITKVDANSYTVTAGVNATGTGSGGGTPSVRYDITAASADSAGGFGYGVGKYGNGPYGVASASAIITPARTWSLYPYGQQLISSPYNGSIYIFDPTAAGRSYPMYNAPTNVLAMIVTHERFVVALGLGLANAMEIAWADQSDYTQWTSTPTNTANAGRQISSGAFLVGGIPVRDGVALFWSNKTAFSLVYSGDNEVYASSGIGDSSGLIGALACCQLNGIAYWMSPTNFLSWNGAVVPLPSDDIRDYVFSNLNVAQAAKCWARANMDKNEVWFFYPSLSSTEIDSYVIYQVDQQIFTIGKRPMTTGVDAGLFPNPIVFDATPQIYNAEVGLDANGAAQDSYVVLAPVDAANGENSLDIMSVIPDFERLTGSGTWTTLYRYYPSDVDSSDGPYTITSSTGKIDTRANARLVGWKFEMNAIGADWRLGVVRMDVGKAGARR